MQIHRGEEGKEEKEAGKAQSFAEKMSGGMTLNWGVEGICDDAAIAGR